jgi:hypothetical protein
LLECRKIAEDNREGHFFILLPAYGSEGLFFMKDRLNSDSLQNLDLSEFWIEHAIEEFCVLKNEVHPCAKVHREIAAQIAS